ncbi:uncharacterized protein LOC105849927 isoform X4 [Hydra vulgaris]|uniref:uncharacterized protein LOC105849927 isoform X4 n=1 Tax=Hydra vulgaris TaxID=6087 RepID=UPI001F5EC27B|nr:uncharacterized protein LOC124812705 isoform X4 [Hydra vulgaris]
MNSDRSFIESITDYPAPHYEGFLRYPTSSSAMSALVPSSIALSVPSTSAIIVTSSAATRGKFINCYFLICVCIIYMCKSIVSNMCMHILSIESKL